MIQRKLTASELWCWWERSRISRPLHQQARILPTIQDVWTNLSVAASALGTPVEQVPNLSTSEILNSLPGSTPETNSSSSSTFFGLALRGYAGTYPVAGGMTITGSTSKKVMIRVKGSSMNFSGTKLNDPKITITKYNTSASTYDSFLTVDNWGDHCEHRHQLFRPGYQRQQGTGCCG